MTDWQPIDTAPLKFEVLICNARTGSRHIASQAKRGEWMTDAGDLLPLGDEPSHWMPLPEPPQHSEN